MIRRGCVCVGGGGGKHCHLVSWSNCVQVAKPQAVTGSQTVFPLGPFHTNSALIKSRREELTLVTVAAVLPRENFVWPGGGGWGGVGGTADALVKIHWYKSPNVISSRWVARAV